MYYDLNVPYIANQAELQRTLAFLADCESIRMILHRSGQMLIALKWVTTPLL